MNIDHFADNSFKIFLILFTFAGFNCTNNPISPVKVSLNTDFDVKFGQAANFSDDDLLITFEDVAEGRCPIGLECFWEGSAYITLKIRKNGKTMIDTVQTYKPDKIIKVGTENDYYEFVVKGLTPYPVYQKETAKEKYTLTLNISRLTYLFDRRIISGN